MIIVVLTPMFAFARERNIYCHFIVQCILSLLVSWYAITTEWIPPPPRAANMSVNWVSIGSGNGLSPVRRQALTWSNAEILNPNRNTMIFIQENVIENFVWEGWLFCPGVGGLKCTYKVPLHHTNSDLADVESDMLFRLPLLYITTDFSCSRLNQTLTIRF